MPDVNTPCVTTSAPGRICLFGEHQDYLGLPVVAAAVTLRVQISGSLSQSGMFSVRMPDIVSQEEFAASGALAYVRERDYLRSAVNVLRRRGNEYWTGCDCEIHGEIPINAGAASSSALVVAWIQFLSLISSEPSFLSPEENAQLAHQAEVLEFNEPGGMMDHCSASYGGVLAIRFRPTLHVTPMQVIAGAFVLGDSMEPKDTTSVLAKSKHRILRIVEILAARHPGFSLDTLDSLECHRMAQDLDPAEFDFLKSTVRNRDITRQGISLLANGLSDLREFGRLLNEQQAILRDALGVSTRKIDRMLDAALAAGALGGKINGSGGGGSMFVYAPDNTAEVVGAIEAAEGRAYVVHIDTGVSAVVK